MYISKLKLIVSSFVVISHIFLFFITFYIATKVQLELNIFEILGAMIPLFGLFVAIIIKDTLHNKFNFRRGKKVNNQMIVITYSILISYSLAISLTFLLFIDQTIGTVEQLSTWLALIESAFGISVGLIIDGLFGGETKS